jgi:hypothetical protein
MAATKKPTCPPRMSPKVVMSTATPLTLTAS